MCCNRLHCNHSRPECFETHPGRTASLALESIRARSSTHPPFFLQQDDSQIQSSGPQRSASDTTSVAWMKD